MKACTSEDMEPRSEEETAAWLIYELRLKQYTLQRIADEQNVSRAAVSKALRKPTKKLGPVICDILGLPHETIWSGVKNRTAGDNHEKNCA
jgi:lambda repressor-like predicted transcriptional regulator